MRWQVPRASAGFYPLPDAKRDTGLVGSLPLRQVELGAHEEHTGREGVNRTAAPRRGFLWLSHGREHDPYSGQRQAHYTYDCSSFGVAGNFAVDATDSGSTDDLLVNALGKGGSATSNDYSTGDLHLEINSECDWTVKVTQ